jgi:retron-type reverse transcriptase
MFIRQYGLCHVVDMDLSKCFDRLDHDLILAAFRRRVRDGSILDLLRMFLVRTGASTIVAFTGVWRDSSILELNRRK